MRASLLPSTFVAPLASTVRRIPQSTAAVATATWRDIAGRMAAGRGARRCTGPHRPRFLLFRPVVVRVTANRQLRRYPPIAHAGIRIPSPAASHTHKESQMNWDRVEGNWKQLKGKVKEQWGKITDDDLDKVAGKRDQLLGKIQNSYGIGKDEAEKQLKDWESRQR